MLFIVVDGNAAMDTVSSGSFTLTVRRVVVVDSVRPPVPGPTPVVRSRGAAPRKGKKHGPE